jgi:hypothetical protein
VLEGRDAADVRRVRPTAAPRSARTNRRDRWDLETCATRTLPLTPLVGKTPERLHFAGSGWLLVERGLFGPHLVVRLDDGACIGTIDGAQAAPVHTTTGAALIGVIAGGELVLHDAATCALIARWRGAAEATAWTQSAAPPWVLAVGDACGDLALLDPARLRARRATPQPMCRRAHAST